MKKNTPKSCGHNRVPLKHFPSYKVILESLDIIVYPHTNLYTTLFHFKQTYIALRHHAPVTLR